MGIATAEGKENSPEHALANEQLKCPAETASLPKYTTYIVILLWLRFFTLLSRWLQLARLLRVFWLYTPRCLSPVETGRLAAHEINDATYVPERLENYGYQRSPTGTLNDLRPGHGGVK